MVRLDELFEDDTPPTVLTPPEVVMEDREDQIGTSTRAMELEARNIFPFFKLPAELRNMVYELLLTPPLRYVTSEDEAQNIADFIDSIFDDYVPFLDPQDATTWNRHYSVILVNELSYVAALRNYKAWSSTLSLPSPLPKWPSHRDFFMGGQGDIMAERICRVYDPSSHMDPAILRICHQAYSEGIAILYSKNTFGVIAPPNDGYRRNFSDELVLARPICTYLPFGMQLSYIQHLRVEIRIQPLEWGGATLGEVMDRGWKVGLLCSSFAQMTGLRTLQIVVTHGGIRDWTDEVGEVDPALRQVAAAVPKGVEVTWGMTQDELACGDVGGYNPIQKVVMEKIIAGEEIDP